MTKLVAIAVYDDSRRMIVSPVVEAEEENEENLWIDTASQIENIMKKKEGIKSSLPTTFMTYNQSPAQIAEKHLQPYVLPKVTLSTKYANGTQGPSAYIWYCYINDKKVGTSKGDYIVTLFNVNKYPNKPAVRIANYLTIKYKMKSIPNILLSKIKRLESEDCQYYRYYERNNYDDYALIVFDPRKKDPLQSIRGRVYAAKLQQ